MTPRCWALKIKVTFYTHCKGLVSIHQLHKNKTPLSFWEPHYVSNTSVSECRNRSATGEAATTVDLFGLRGRRDWCECLEKFPRTSATDRAWLHWCYANNQKEAGHRLLLRITNYYCWARGTLQQLSICWALHSSLRGLQPVGVAVKLINDRQYVHTVAKNS